MGSGGAPLLGAWWPLPLALLLGTGECGLPLPLVRAPVIQGLAREKRPSCSFASFSQ